MSLRSWLLAATLVGAACRSPLPGEPVAAHDVILRLERSTPRNGDNATVIIDNTASAPRYYLTCGTEPFLHMERFEDGEWKPGPIPGCSEGGWVELGPGEERGAHLALDVGIHRATLTVTDVLPSESSESAVSNPVQIVVGAWSH